MRPSCPGSVACICSSGRFHSEMNLWDPKAMRDREEMSAVCGNLFATAAIYAAVADACTILVQGFLEGESKRDRAVADDHLDLDSLKSSSPFCSGSITRSVLLSLIIGSTTSQIRKIWLISRDRDTFLSNRRGTISQLHRDGYMAPWAPLSPLAKRTARNERTVSSSRIAHTIRITHPPRRVLRVFRVCSPPPSQNVPQ